MRGGGGGGVRLPRASSIVQRSFVCIGPHISRIKTYHNGMACARTYMSTIWQRPKPAMSSVPYVVAHSPDTGRPLLSEKSPRAHTIDA